MTRPIRLCMWLEALIHRFELTTQGFVQLGMLIGLFIISILSMLVVIVFNLLSPKERINDNQNQSSM
jgi:competence protein ComGC